MLIFLVGGEDTFSFFGRRTEVIEMSPLSGFHRIPLDRHLLCGIRAP